MTPARATIPSAQTPFPRRTALAGSAAAGGVLAAILLAACTPTDPEPEVDLGSVELQQALSAVQVSGHRFAPVEAGQLQSPAGPGTLSEDLEIDPPKCRALLEDSISRQSGDLARAAIVSGSMTVSAVAYPTEDAASAQLEAALAIVETCPEMTTTSGGSSSTTVTEGLESSVAADQTAANMQSTGNEDLALSSVTSTARSGPVLVTATMSSPPSKETALAELDSAVQQSIDALSVP